MSAEPKRYPEMDGLLRQALADDLPAEVAAGMRDRIERFRAKRPGEGAASAAWALIFRRGLWAAVSILMLLAGLVLQGTKVSNPLADQISSIKTAYANLEPIRR